MPDLQLGEGLALVQFQNLVHHFWDVLTQELELAVHITSTDRKWRDEFWCLTYFLLFYSDLGSSPWNCASQNCAGS